MQAFFQSLPMILEEAFIDTLKALPVLFCVYILVSYLEHNPQKYNAFFKKAEKFGPVVGAGLGVVPQCGFSVAMADLYNKKSITLGTLLAVFIATSDEAIPILLSNHKFLLPMIMLIIIKFVYAIFCGYVIDFVLKFCHKKRQNHIALESMTTHGPCDCGHTHEHEEHNNSDVQKNETCGHCCADNIFIDAIIHTLKIALFIVIVNIIMGVIVNLSGLNLSSFLNINKYVQPFITALIGLIPNCVASVLLVEIYMAGGITFGALLAGLCSGAGLGILVLFKRNKNKWLKNIGIVGIVYLMSILIGIVVSLF